MAAVEDAAAGIEPRYPSELGKLENFTGLKGDSLASFLKLLNFDDRQEDFWWQKNNLLQEIYDYLPGFNPDATLRLKDLVEEKASSRAGEDPTIRETDVLRVLGTREKALFPSPCMIENLNENTIPFPQEEEFIHTIINSDSQVIIHAEAGVGKTVFATRIQDNLPNQSKCVLYDCFGNGSYRNLETYRHHHKEAFVQIINELALEGLCYPLAPVSNVDNSAYMQAFSHSIERASEFMRSKDPDALICIVVDAADNAQMASEEIGENRSFVQDIIRKKMPVNVRLVFLCRTRRQEHLKQPFEAISLTLSPFDQEGTKRHLQQKFADATKYDVKEFHDMTLGNPRVQAFAISNSHKFEEALSSLGPDPITVEDTFKNLLNRAINKIKSEASDIERGQIEKICRGLAVLRPPVPISILSEISGVNEGEIRSFATDLGRPLLRMGNAIEFSNEPAETWFREEFIPKSDEMDNFITILESLAKTSGYAASILPQLMLKAEKFQDLVDLTLASRGLPENDLLAKHNVELQRLQFALKSALRLKDYLASAKLTLKASWATTGKSRRDIILQIFINGGYTGTFSSRAQIFRLEWLISHFVHQRNSRCSYSRDNLPSIHPPVMDFLCCL